MQHFGRAEPLVLFSLLPIPLPPFFPLFEEQPSVVLQGMGLRDSLWNNLIPLKNLEKF